MDCLVTGATGHVGANLVRALLRQGRSVRAFVLPGDRRGIESLDVACFEGDVLDAEALARALSGVGTLFHLAGRISIDGDPDGSVWQVNVEGTKTVAAAALAAGVNRMVHVSSVHAFVPEPIDEVLDENRARVGPRHPAYDRTKLAGEREVRRAIRRGLDAVIVHPTSIIGPGDHLRSHMGRFFLDLQRGSLPALLEGGFDWVDVRDVVAGLLAAETRGRRGESYLLSGHYHTIRELGAMAEESTGVRPPRFVAPAQIGRAVAPIARSLAHLLGSEPLLTPESMRALRGNRRVSHAKATAELGYQPRDTRDSIAAIYAWFEAAGALAPRRETAPTVAPAREATGA